MKNRCIFLALLLSWFHSFSQSSLIRQWDVSYGSSMQDFLFDIERTSDNGCVLAGYTSASVNGDKTVPTRGSDDFWLIKINSSGITEWQKDYG
ncbi:MAG: T9SS C-terminal target domain-containing protein, partial [Bacteroidota bacterium]